MPRDPRREPRKRRRSRSVIQCSRVSSLYPLPILTFLSPRYRSIQPLEQFTNLKVLILDHNNFTSTRSFPACPNLETLSLAYNTMRDADQTLMHLASSVSRTTLKTLSLMTSCDFWQYPKLKHLNLIKTPINPMFSGQSTKYDAFRAKFKIWLPTLATLDGTDFSKDEVKISELRAQVEAEKRQKTSTLSTIPEEAKGQSSSG